MKRRTANKPFVALPVEPMPDDLPVYLPDGMDPRLRAIMNAPLPPRREQVALRELSAAWGEFVVDRARTAELCGKDWLTHAEAHEAEMLVKKTMKKVDDKVIAVAAFSEGVDWPDERVEHFIVELTRRDKDRAKVRNDIGWGAQYSSTGHWCNAMLERNRALAIRVARTIVGGYVKQLEGKR